MKRRDAATVVRPSATTYFAFSLICLHQGTTIDI